MDADGSFVVYRQRARARRSGGYPTMCLVFATGHKQTAKVYVAQREALGHSLTVFYRDPDRGIVTCIHSTFGDVSSQ